MAKGIVEANGGIRHESLQTIAVIASLPSATLAEVAKDLSGTFCTRRPNLTRNDHSSVWHGGQSQRRAEIPRGGCWLTCLWTSRLCFHPLAGALPCSLYSLSFYIGAIYIYIYTHTCVYCCSPLFLSLSSLYLFSLSLFSHMCTYIYIFSYYFTLSPSPLISLWSLSDLSLISLSLSYLFFLLSRSPYLEPPPLLAFVPLSGIHASVHVILADMISPAAPTGAACTTSDSNSWACLVESTPSQSSTELHMEQREEVVNWEPFTSAQRA